MKFNKDQKKRLKSFKDELNGLLRKYEIEPVIELVIDGEELATDILYIPSEKVEEYQTEVLDKESQKINENYS